MTENAVKNKVADRMRRLCSRREYCVADIRRKLSDALEGDRDAVHEVLDCLIREKYVDDMRYASAFARDKASIAGWGSIKISHALLAKGVDRVIIGEALFFFKTALTFSIISFSVIAFNRYVEH